MTLLSFAALLLNRHPRKTALPMPVMGRQALSGRGAVVSVAGNAGSGLAFGSNYAVTANQAPTANAGPDQPVAAKAAVALIGAASLANDPGQSLTFAWVQTDGPTLSLADADTASPRFAAPTLASADANLTLTFKPTVSDGTDTIAVLVTTAWAATTLGMAFSPATIAADGTAMATLKLTLPKAS